MDCEASVWVLSGAITVLLRLAQFSRLSPLGIHCMCQKTQPERKPRGGVWSPYRHWPLLIYRSRELSRPSHIPIEKFLSYIQEKRARGQLCPHCCLCLARGRWSPISNFSPQGFKVTELMSAPLPWLLWIAWHSGRAFPTSDPWCLRSVLLSTWEPEKRPRLSTESPSEWIEQIGGRQSKASTQLIWYTWILVLQVNFLWAVASIYSSVSNEAKGEINSLYKCINDVLVEIF